MPYSLPHYAVIRDGNVISRSESFALATQVFMQEMKENEFLELTIQNVRAIKILADRVIGRSTAKTKERVG